MKHSRRNFLKRSGGGLLAVPFLHSLSPWQKLLAQEIQTPKRFVTFMMMYGGIWDHLKFSQKAVSNFENVPNLGSGLSHAYGDDALSEHIVGGEFSPLVGSVLNGYTNKVSVIRGNDIARPMGHSDGATLGNAIVSQHRHDPLYPMTAVPTIDRVMARHIYPEGYIGVPSVNIDMTVGAHAGISFDYENQIDYSGNIIRVPNVSTPTQLFNQLFGGFSGGDSASPSQQAKALLVDSALDDFNSIRNHSRISSEDRQKLENHMEYLFQIQTRLISEGPGCTQPDAPGSNGSALDYSSYRLFIDILSAAFACDLTRVASFRISRAQEHFIGGEGTSTWHRDSHDWLQDVAHENLLDLNRDTFREIFGYYLQRMDAVSEANGKTLLDNSMTYYTEENSTNHANKSLFTVIAGSNDGALRTGRYLDYRNLSYDGPLPPLSLNAHFSTTDDRFPSAPGLLQNKLLITFLNAMGVSASQFNHAAFAPGTYGETYRPPEAFEGRVAPQNQEYALPIMYASSRLDELSPGLMI